VPSQHADTLSAAPSLFGLAPSGVCLARPITGAAVRSYRTFSPLPCYSCHPLHQRHRITGTAGRYVFCGTFRRNGVKSIRPDVIRHPALWSSDFPPLSCAASTNRPFAGRSDRPVRLSTISL